MFRTLSLSLIVNMSRLAAVSFFPVAHWNRIALHPCRYMSWRLGMFGPTVSPFLIPAPRRRLVFWQIDNFKAVAGFLMTLSGSDNATGGV